MKEENQILDTIDNYLNNRMSAAERIAFEERMAADFSLSEQVEKERAINEAVHFANLAELRSSIGADIKTIKYNSGNSSNKYLASALLVTSALIGGYLFFNQERPEKISTKTPIEIQTKPESKKTEDHTSDEKEKSTPPVEKSFPSKNISETKTQESPALPIEKTTATPSADQQIVNSEQKTISSIPTENSPKPEPNEPGKQVAVTDIATTDCNLKFDISTKPSCADNATGAIIIKNPNSEDLTIELDQTLTYATNGELKNIAAGEHEILIKYRDNCKYNQSVTVAEEWCSLNSNFSFNPEYGEKWELKYHSGERGNFTILNNFGKEVYQGQFGNGNSYWNGADNYGSVLPIGTYTAIISHNNGRKERVELTIIR